MAANADVCDLLRFGAACYLISISGKYLILIRFFFYLGPYAVKRHKMSNHPWYKNKWFHLAPYLGIPIILANRASLAQYTWKPQQEIKKFTHQNPNSLAVVSRSWIIMASSRSITVRLFGH